MFDRESRLAPAAGLNPVGPTLKCCADQFNSEPGLIVKLQFRKRSVLELVS